MCFMFFDADGMLDAIHDVTIGYPRTQPKNELDIIRGKFPEEIHFYIKRHPVVTFPISEKGSCL